MFIIMSTRSGRRYKSQTMSLLEPSPVVQDAKEGNIPAAAGISNPDISALMTMLIHDCRQREEEISRDRARREHEMEQQVSEMREKMDAMYRDT